MGCRATGFVLVLAIVMAAGCGDGGGSNGSSADSGGGADGLTYHNTIRALMETNCVGCHQAGGVGPFELTSYAAVMDVGPALIAEVTAGNMPPWQADPECRPMMGERFLTEEAIAAFAEWGEAGQPEGDPADYTPPAIASAQTRLPPGDPDLVLRGEPYAPHRDRPDDFRCLPLTQTFEEDTFVVGADLVPDQREVVHHVIVFLVPPDDVGRMEQLDGEGGEPGYVCYGGPRVGDFEILAGWVPGSEPQFWPDGAAVRVPQGYRLVMQMHYNVSAVPEEDPIPADQSELALWTLPAGETPDEIIDFTLFGNFSLFIEAGDPSSIHESTFPVPFEADIVGILPHMHTLGTTIRVDLEYQSGEEECLAHVPYWDFNWQQLYQYPEGTYPHVRPGDSMRLRCEYDNRATNQPVVNGERLEPRDVTFGESTFDEMCLHFLITSRPYQPDEGGQCGGFESCVETCGEGDSQCALGCMFASGQGCAVCTIGGFDGCARDFCNTLTPPLYACFGGCSDPLSCFLEDCAPEYDAVYDCLEPHLLAGECDARLSGCEVAFGD